MVIEIKVKPHAAQEHDVEFEAKGVGKKVKTSTLGLHYFSKNEHYLDGLDKSALSHAFLKAQVVHAFENVPGTRSLRVHVGGDRHMVALHEQYGFEPTRTWNPEYVILERSAYEKHKALGKYAQQ